MFSILLDENASSRALVTGLRRFTEVYVAIDWLPRGSSDEAQLAFAHSVGAVLYSFDTDDFPRIHRDWVRDSREHSGIILNPSQMMPVGMQIEALVTMMNAFDATPMHGRLEYLTNWRRS